MRHSLADGVALYTIIQEPMRCGAHYETRAENAANSARESKKSKTDMMHLITQITRFSSLIRAVWTQAG